jgi:hypothetical protein
LCEATIEILEPLTARLRHALARIRLLSQKTPRSAKDHWRLRLHSDTGRSRACVKLGIGVHRSRLLCVYPIGAECNRTGGIGPVDVPF